jgi:hypothetical protein
MISCLNKDEDPLFEIISYFDQAPQASRIWSHCVTSAALPPTPQLRIAAMEEAEDTDAVEACLAHTVCAGRPELDAARRRILSD